MTDQDAKNGATALGSELGALGGGALALEFGVPPAVGAAVGATVGGFGTAFVYDKITGKGKKDVPEEKKKKHKKHKKKKSTW